jgi:hypothetical protein
VRVRAGEEDTLISSNVTEVAQQVALHRQLLGPACSVVQTYNMSKV